MCEGEKCSGGERGPVHVQNLKQQITNEISISGFRAWGLRMYMYIFYMCTCVYTYMFVKHMCLKCHAQHSALSVFLDAHVAVGSSQPADMATPGRPKRKKPRGAEGVRGREPEKLPQDVFDVAKVPQQVPMLLADENGDLREIGHWRKKFPCEVLSFWTPQKVKENQTKTEHLAEFEAVVYDRTHGAIAPQHVPLVPSHLGDGSYAQCTVGAGVCGPGTRLKRFVFHRQLYLDMWRHFGCNTGINVNVPKTHEVHHIDKSKTNHRLSNLQAVTVAWHRWEHGVDGGRPSTPKPQWSAARLH